MHIVVIAEGNIQNELNEKGINDGTVVQFVTTVEEAHKNADAVFYLLSEVTLTENISLLGSFNCPVFVNAATITLSELPTNFIRINSWPGFLLKPLLELSALPEMQQKAENILNKIGWKFQWVPDVPGFISLRTIAMIINEAYYALEDEVSTKEEIDTAMKLGTNYPHGPFEWSEIIGLEKIYSLLLSLAKTDGRYKPSELITKEIK